jgi:hypothetical protein
MAYGTTIPVQVCTGLPGPTCEVMDTGPRTERLRVEVAGQRFRVQTPRVSTQWLPDTPSNRHPTVVWLRLRMDEHGKPLCTLQDLAPIVGSTNRQVASQHLEDFRQGGEDMRAFVLRQRKVDATWWRAS